MDTMINTGSDVITFLKSQHEDIKGLLERVEASKGPDRTQAFLALRKMLAVHETAEEEIVHPAARHAVPGGDTIVQARLQEENEAKKALAELEKLDADSQEFESKFHVFKGAVIAHAGAEEREEFDRLASRLDAARLERMRKAAQLAESVAPTRPHPGVESAAANLLIGPFAAMVDRSRDALSKH
jgi:hemerythrin superfamily protein